MKDHRLRNVAASVRQQLLNISRERSEDFNFVLTRYACERLLYRLSISDWRNRFLLKGATLFYLWDAETHRPTRDIDLLGYGDPDIEAMVEIFQMLCTIEVEVDGVEFQPTTVRGRNIREGAHYDGIRVVLDALIEKARVRIQVDIGFGDAVSPEPQNITLPTLLNFPAARLAAYPVYTVVAEKYHAIVEHGITNSRMKDYFDLLTIARNQPLDMTILGDAIAATFARRRTEIPQSTPTGLTQAFAGDTTKQRQWNAFLQRNGLAPESFTEAVETIATLLRPFYNRL